LTFGIAQLDREGLGVAGSVEPRAVKPHTRRWFAIRCKNSDRICRKREREFRQSPAQHRRSLSPYSSARRITQFPGVELRSLVTALLAISESSRCQVTKFAIVVLKENYLARHLQLDLTSEKPSGRCGETEGSKRTSTKYHIFSSDLSGSSFSFAASHVFVL
jgi:hypothetical protein